jgi:TPR repeat protein
MEVRNGVGTGGQVTRRERFVVMASLAACMTVWTVQPVRAEPLDDARAALSRGDAATALRIYRSLADRGNVTAMVQLGMMYRNGQGTPRDFDTALEWLDRAAALGSAEAQYQVGDMHLRGLGTSQDLLIAARYHSRAAEQGHAKAQYVLGILYKLGGGVSKNLRKAARWLGRSAVQGVPEAQYEIGEFYASGAGVSRNYVTAYKWLTLARSNSSNGQVRAKAAETLRRLEGRMSHVQIAQARDQARSWRAVPEG